MRTIDTRPRLAAAAFACCAGLLAIACGAGPTPTPGPSPTPAPTPTPLATPAPTPPVPTEVPTATASLPPFACGETIRRPGTVPLAYITGLEVANRDGVGRVTITFRAAGNVAAVPEVEIRPTEPPFTMDPSDLPLDVPGRGFVTLVLLGGTALDADFNPTFEGPVDIDVDGSPIRAIRRAGDWEAVSTFVVGLDGDPCVRVLPPDGTSRLVIELTTE